MLFLNSYIDFISNKSLHDNRLAFARTLFALGSIGTLLFTDINQVTNPDILDMDLMSGVNYFFGKRISLFNLFDVQLAKWLSITILLFSVTGFLPQLSIILQAWVHVSICNSFYELDGGDQIAANLCLLLIPICLLDNRINAWKNYNSHLRLNINVFCNVFFFLILLQVAVIYFHAGAGKLNVEEWLDGTCLYYWTTNNVFGAPETIQPFLNFFTLSSIAPILTWGVIFLELCLFGCLFSTSTALKRLFLFLGISFHFSIFIVHGLASFFLSTSGALILFLDNENYIFNQLTNIYNKSKSLIFNKN